jgi:hypothetical protein
MNVFMDTFLIAVNRNVFVGTLSTEGSPLVVGPEPAEGGEKG